MHYSPGAVNLGGLIMTGVGFAASAGTWAAHKLSWHPAPFVQLVGQATPDAGTQAGNNAVWLGAAGIVTILVNGGVAAYKNHNDTEQKIAESEARIAQKVVEAKDQLKRETDAKIEAAREAHEGEIAGLRLKEIETRARREAERDFQAAKIFSLMDELAELRDNARSLGGLTERNRKGVNENSTAIQAVADEVHVEIHPSEPIDAGTAEHAVLGVPRPRAVDPSLPRLLMVEDVSGKEVASYLKRLGWDVTLATSAFEGSRHMNTLARPFDCVAVDLKLPDVPGVELIKLVRQCAPTQGPDGKRPRIVAFTGCDPGDPLIAQAIEAGADEVLFKPCDPTLLEAVLKGEKHGEVSASTGGSPRG